MKFIVICFGNELYGPPTAWVPTHLPPSYIPPLSWLELLTSLLKGEGQVQQGPQFRMC